MSSWARLGWRGWYGLLAWYVRRREADFCCMNWGYDDGRELVGPEFGVERYPLQLYHALVEHETLRDATLVDLSCGRGGGLAYLHRRFAPVRAIGIDFTPGNIAACRRSFAGRPGLSFEAGDALAPPLPRGSADLALSVEASHCYGDLDAFLDAAIALLRPGGRLLWTDYTTREGLADIDAAIARRFELVEARDLTTEVLAGMAADGPRRKALVREHSARVLQPLLLHFAAADDTRETVQRFRTGAATYFMRRLAKPGGHA